ncbi:MAG TPA: YbaK/EbsC family protein [Nocardioidaceae bacterium]|nr:YbaK/EbsC family protein [Nocardioidaceae bacterium]
MTADAHPSVARVAADLRASGATGTPRMLPAATRTAAQAAAALDCDVGAIANSLIFDSDGAAVLILTSGSHRVDTAKCAAEIGATSLRRATPEFVRAHTGQPIGGVAPVGHPAPVRTFVDRWLDRHEQVWAAAGHPHSIFATTYDELLRLTGGQPIDVE